ncbi:hypothetical protein [Amycolatopsis thermoflava]|uniref:hypothetical protein n=1 Tax=Amycolatopsis thermoflava TaxID=84480 RepID=UPI0036508FDE
MTYPPQPGQSYGPQPGAYGQGGYPQQQGPFPPGGGHPQPFPPGGGYPPPQPPKKTGLWIGLTAGVLVVVAFLVTAFAAPGFLLGDDENGAAADRAPDAGDSPAANLVDEISRRFLAHDESGLNQLACSGAEVAIEGYTREAGMYQAFTLNGPVQETTGTATATAHVVLEAEGRRVEGDLVISLADENGSWCLKDLEEARK